MDKTKVVKRMFIISVFLLLAGCLSIPTGDGGSVSLSKDGVQIETSEGERTNIQLDRNDNRLTVTGGDGEEKFIVEENNGEIHYQVTDSEGTVSDTRVIAQIPEGFPSDIPIPDNATELTSIVNESDGNKLFIISFEVPDAIVYDYYQLYLDYLERGNYENIIGADGNNDPDMFMVNLMGETAAGKLTIGIMVAGTGEFDKGAVRVNMSYSEK